MTPFSRNDTGINHCRRRSNPLYSDKGGAKIGIGVEAGSAWTSPINRQVVGLDPKERYLLDGELGEGSLSQKSGDQRRGRMERTSLFRYAHV
jgi:hypothetical protein